MEQQVTQLFSNPWFYVPFILWGMFWKAWGLWTSAGNKHLVWFLVIMFFNTMGILEIAYIFKLQKIHDLGSKKLLEEINKRFPKKA